MQMKKTDVSLNVNKKTVTENIRFLGLLCWKKNTNQNLSYFIKATCDVLILELI